MINMVFCCRKSNKDPEEVKEAKEVMQQLTGQVAEESSSSSGRKRPRKDLLATLSSILIDAQQNSLGGSCTTCSYLLRGI